MDLKLNKLIGAKKSEFDSLIQAEKGIRLRRARLIPTTKVGDELSLTSIFLSSLRLIDEFKRHIFKAVKLPLGGKMYVYTEVSFPAYEDSRIDGLIIIVKSGKITDAAILEMKNKNNELDAEQINRYIDVAKGLKIPKLITVSNQFVSEPTQNPLNIKPPKSIQLYHLSWTYILTIAHLLMFNNNMNISDSDQENIMSEVISYLESSVSGVIGVTQMRKGWDELTRAIYSGVSFKHTDEKVAEAVLSWHQQERDMGLALSRKVGVLVKTGFSKYRTDLKKRLSDDSKKLASQNSLDSIMKIDGAVSDIAIKAVFDKKTIEMSVELAIPEDKTLRGQIGWLKRQIDKCRKQCEQIALSEDIDYLFKRQLFIDANIKFAKSDHRVLAINIESLIEDLKGKDINSIKVVLSKDFKSSFTSRKKFVSTIDNLLIDFYRGFVEHLESWKKPSPKVIEKVSFQQEDTYIDNPSDL